MQKTIERRVPYRVTHRVTLLAFGLVVGVMMLWAEAVQAVDHAARINMIRGNATASTDDGSIRILGLGDLVHSGEVISTGPNSQVNLKFVDNAFVLVRSNSRFVIEDYTLSEEDAEAVENGEADFEATAEDAARPKSLADRVKKNASTAETEEPPKKVTGSDLASATRSIRRAKASASRSAPSSSSSAGGSRGFFRLIKGGFRAVTGLIARRHREDFRVNTPVATIGVRGTDYAATICDAACASDPVVREALTDGAIAEGGLIVSVFSGTVTVGSGDADCSGPCEVSAPQFVLVTADGTQIVLDQAPHFLQVDPAPDPASCGA